MCAKRKRAKPREAAVLPESHYTTAKTLCKCYFQEIPCSQGVPGHRHREPEWSTYSGALGGKFLRLDQFLKSTSAKAEENVPNPRLFP